MDVEVASGKGGAFLGGNGDINIVHEISALLVDGVHIGFLRVSTRQILSWSVLSSTGCTEF